MPRKIQYYIRENLNLINKFNFNYISIIIFKVILKYMRIKSDIKNISLN